jgi:phosphoglycerol transferase MdoB-like AlkP superfamily enzyme
VTHTYLQQLFILLKRLLICYLVYFISRLIFFFPNRNYLPDIGFGTLLLDCIYGLRFDTFSIIATNGLFILLSILPFNFFYKKNYQQFLFWIYIIFNSVFTALNFIDSAYFPFIKKRSGKDLLMQISGQSDLGKLLPQFAKDFWWAFLLYTLVIVLMIYLYRKIKVDQRTYSLKKRRSLVYVVLIFLFTSGLMVLGVRGGTQRIPIGVVDVGLAVGPAEVPIVLNTPFTLLKSINEKGLQEYHFFDEKQLKTIYNPIHYFKDSTFKKQNVVVIILESFAKEYTKLSGLKSYTPFLDSLMDHSMVFSNGYSNGTKSIEGIPAILSSLPSFMENPFINSMYASNQQTSFATLLGNEGYETAFFHGGINGTMNFDTWAPLAGYKHYFGRNEYNDEKDFDNFWGIWDEPFLQYAAKEISKLKTPFHSAIFTLSSHHPYFVPEKYKNKFPKGQLENLQSIGYADYALRLFFDAAKKTKWYNNTLFILVGDHGSLSEHFFFSNLVGNQSIPILFFKPDNSLKSVHKEAFSQMDILPTAMEVVGYNKPFFAFGEPYNSPQRGNDFFFAGSTHYFFGDSTLYCYNVTDKPVITRAYIFTRDSLFRNDIHNKYPAYDSINLTRLKAFIQTYNHTLINNTGIVK